MRSCNNINIVICTIFLATACFASAETSVADAQSIAKEAFIYAYPMLYGYKTMQEQTQDPFNGGYIGGFGQFRHYSKPSTPDDKDIVSPNNDTPYSWAWLDLRAEPWVLSVPAVPQDRYYVLQWFDLYTHNFAYVGVRSTGFDKGSYLFAGPHWDGEVPDGINKVFRSEGEFIGTLTRTSLDGPEDVPSVRAIQRQYVLQPLSEFAGGRAAMPAAELHFPPWNEEHALSPNFISYLNFLLQFTEPHPSEQELLARFADIGIGPGRTFDLAQLSEEMREALHSGVKEGLLEIETQGPKQRDSSILFGARQQLDNNYLNRAMGAYLGIYANSVEEAFYSQWTVDQEGKPLDGNNEYEIHFPEGNLPPVKFFWSVTMYDLPDRFLVANELDRYSIGDRTDGLKYGDDGSLTLYIQHEAPEGDKRSNWLPAPAGPFFMASRFYGPGEPMIDGSYNIPQCKRVP